LPPLLGTPVRSSNSLSSGSGSTAFAWFSFFALVTSFTKMYGWIAGVGLSHFLQPKSDLLAVRAPLLCQCFWSHPVLNSHDYVLSAHVLQRRYLRTDRPCSKNLFKDYDPEQYFKLPFELWASEGLNCFLVIIFISAVNFVVSAHQTHGFAVFASSPRHFSSFPYSN
jgi:hypothetical protein